MDFFTIHLNWSSILLPHTPFVEIVIRGTLVYLSLFIMLRFIVKREAGTLGITDLLLLVLLADAAQNAMAGSYQSVADGIILVGTIVFWSVMLNFFSFKSKTAEKVLKPRKLLLINKGRFIKNNMESELITKDELMSEVRMQGISNIREVEKAYIEPDGSISIIKKNKEDTSQTKKPKPRI
jgi:uncharacterized membrane protein YcaP (DUF421 family)